MNNMSDTRMSESDDEAGNMNEADDLKAKPNQSSGDGHESHGHALAIPEVSQSPFSTPFSGVAFSSPFSRDPSAC